MVSIKSVLAQGEGRTIKDVYGIELEDCKFLVECMYLTGKDLTDKRKKRNEVNLKLYTFPTNVYRKPMVMLLRRLSEDDIKNMNKIFTTNELVIFFNNNGIYGEINMKEIGSYNNPGNEFYVANFLDIKTASYIRASRANHTIPFSVYSLSKDELCSFENMLKIPGNEPGINIYQQIIKEHNERIIRDFENDDQVIKFATIPDYKNIKIPRYRSLAQHVCFRERILKLCRR